MFSFDLKQEFEEHLKGNYNIQHVIINELENAVLVTLNTVNARYDFTISETSTSANKCNFKGDLWHDEHQTTFKIRNISLVTAFDLVYETYKNFNNSFIKKER